MVQHARDNSYEDPHSKKKKMEGMKGAGRGVGGEDWSPANMKSSRVNSIQCQSLGIILCLSALRASLPVTPLPSASVPLSLLSGPKACP